MEELSPLLTQALPWVLGYDPVRARYALYCARLPDHVPSTKPRHFGAEAKKEIGGGPMVLEKNHIHFTSVSLALVLVALACPDSTHALSDLV